MSQKTIEKGRLQYFSNLEQYGVEYGWHGYCTLLDDPERWELRLEPAEDWLPVNQAPLQDWLDQVVELRDKSKE